MLCQLYLARLNLMSLLIFVYRMLIQYGLMRGLIRQLKKYPVFVESDDSESLPGNLRQLMP